MTARLVVLAALVAASAVLAAVLTRREGRVRAVDGSTAFTSAQLRAPLGSSATFVQFSSTTCSPCRAVRRMLGQLAAGVPGVVHVELDADSCADLARRHHVLSTPTVLVLDASGRVRQRLSGVPERHRLLEVLADLAPATFPPAPRPAPDASEEIHG